MPTCSDFLRGYLLLGCIFNIGLAIGAIVAGVYISNMRNEFMVNSSGEAMKKYLAIGLYGLGSLCALTGLLGIFAFWKKIKCFQALFIIFNILFFIIFAALFAGLMVAQPFMNELKNNPCNSISALSSADNVFQKDLLPYYCRLPSSVTSVNQGGKNTYPCYIKDITQWSSYTQEMISIKNIVYTQVPGSITEITQCTLPEVVSTMSSYTTEINLLKAVEEVFNCVGVCQGDYFYYFSDINRGPPSSTTDGCYKSLKDFILKTIGGVFIFVVIATVFTFLNVVIGFMNCCCCTPKEEPQDKSGSLQKNLINDTKHNNNSYEMSINKPLNPVMNMMPHMQMPPQKVIYAQQQPHY